MSSSKPSYPILGITGFLVFFGLLMIASAGAVISQERFGQSFYYVKSQLLHGLLPGIVLGLAAYIIPTSFWRKNAKFIFFIALVLMILVFVPGVGLEFGGAKRWISVAGQTFQPSEFFKLAFLIYLAAFLEKNSGSIKKEKKGLVIFGAVMAVPILLIGLEPDLGTLSVFIGAAFLMYIVAKAPLMHLTALAAFGTGMFLLFIKFLPHARQRIMVFFNSDTDPGGIGYQINQSLIALGSGGFFGQGLTQSKQKFLYLPQPAGDSIAAVLGEEFGFLGMLILSALFAAFAFFGFKIAQKAQSEFSKLLAVGIVSFIVIQAFVNIAAIADMIPLTGITLPFISHGGSSLVVCLTAVGMLLKISKEK
ncbi:MAG: putative lipid II flippase FtsW [Candidatus Portnoybacteria bacterium]|nr:putative lipid II flippase FtsW [Candidatus Portnoybacteria bacterium]